MEMYCIGPSGKDEKLGGYGTYYYVLASSEDMAISYVCDFLINKAKNDKHYANIYMEQMKYIKKRSRIVIEKFIEGQVHCTEMS